MNKKLINDSLNLYNQSIKKNHLFEELE